MRKFIPYCVLLTALLLPTAGRAQLGGFNAKGDFGLLAGSQAPLALIPRAKR